MAGGILMGERSEREQALLDLPSEDFEDAMRNLLDNAGSGLRRDFRDVLLSDAEKALLEAAKAYGKDSRGAALGDLQSAASDYAKELHGKGAL